MLPRPRPGRRGRPARRSTPAQHGSAARQCSTAVQHGSAARQCSTAAQHASAARQCSTPAQHASACPKPHRSHRRPPLRPVWRPISAADHRCHDPRDPRHRPARRAAANPAASGGKRGVMVRYCGGSAMAVQGPLGRRHRRRHPPGQHRPSDRMKSPDKTHTHGPYGPLVGCPPGNGGLAAGRADPATLLAAPRPGSPLPLWLVVCCFLLCCPPGGAWSRRGSADAPGEPWDSE